MRCTPGYPASSRGRPYPADTPYRTDDPERLLWVLFTLVNSTELVYRRYVAELDRDERERLWADYRVVGRLFGLADTDMPASLDELEEYRRGMLDGDRLHVSDWARRRAVGAEYAKRVLLPVTPRRLRLILQVREAMA